MWGVVLAGGLGSLLGVLSTPSNPLGVAHYSLAALVRNVELLERIRAKAPHDGWSENCAAEKTAEARIGLHIGEQEIARLQDAMARKDDEERDYALRRLGALVDRGKAVAADARRCIALDPGSITATTVEVEVPPQLPKETDIAPPLPTLPDMRPAEGAGGR